MKNLKIKANQREFIFQLKEINSEKINQICGVSSGKNNYEKINKNEKNKNKFGKLDLS